MKYNGNQYIRIFLMTLRETPMWPITQPQFIQSSSRVCLNWTLTVNTDDNTRLRQILRAEIRPQNPKIKVLVEELFIFLENTSMICLPKLPYADQVYTFRFRRRYNITHFPWSSAFKSKKIRSMSSIPARAPEILPNGFYHDAKKNHLFVFWRQLDELELNGPNFTYAAATGTGKNPSSIDSNCALFSDWDPTIPGIIYVWSQNSMGNSTATTRLEVPLLTNSESLQIRGLRYYDNNYTLT
ncbi:cytokine receptor-like [Drosophila kikkawai]|uniref:Cytokine receptor-like n=1 Tax=Drosophila kikkawai TaxID=30033 RepID=A0A6P4JER9_DROKI|nr:cytokine receptor-like [Drosophila kikkawai]